MTRPACVILGLLVVAAAASAERVVEEPRATHPTSFAIVVDTRSYEAARDALRAYKAAVEADGLAAWLVADRWASPEEVRALIRELADAEPPLEGAVFVGAVPVPMIRDAQHLTSAFKMDQRRYPKRRSSVPSDRYYEDLDLDLEPLGPDPDEPLLHYYSLSSTSPQRIEKEIYSGRILFGETPDPERLRRWLATVVRRKKERRPLADALVVTGHGYNSGSIGAWAGQGWLLREQMPWLFRPGHRVRRLYHADHRDLKARVLRAIAEESVNLAVFHAHGRADKQHLLGLQPAATTLAQAESIRRDLRTRLRRVRDRGGDVGAARAELMKRFDLPASWFEGALDPDRQREDEAADALTEIRVTDLAGVATAPEVVVFDECFNGRFIETESIADAYVFGPGGTVAAVANTVNVLQDVWADEWIGLLGLGMRVGRWHRMRPHLESHVIGDPTFRFAAREETATLRRALDLVRRHRAGTLSPGALGAILRGDASDTVRLTALACLARTRAEDLGDDLLVAARDPSEMIRRQAVRLLGDRGDPSAIETLLAAAASDPSRRVAFQARTALSRFEAAPIRAAIDAMDAPDDVKTALRDRHGKPNRFLIGDLATALDGSAEPEKRVRAIRTFRLYRVDAAVPGLIGVARSAKAPEEVRRAALEALGWFVQSRRRAEIAAACAAILASEPEVPVAVRAEAGKTARRLEAGPNDPFTP